MTFEKQMFVHKIIIIIIIIHSLTLDLIDPTVGEVIHIKDEIIHSFWIQSLYLFQMKYRQTLTVGFSIMNPKTFWFHSFCHNFCKITTSNSMVDKQELWKDYRAK